MKAQCPVRVLNLILLAGVAALPACVQPRTTDASAQEVESLTRYASRMEQLYAEQEAEILALRQEVAGLRSQPNN